MQWLTSLLSVLALMIAMICAITVTVLSRNLKETLRLLSAEIAAVSMRLGAIEQTERLTPSRLAELADVKDAIDKGNALLKKVNSREVMRARRDAGELDGPVTKEELRRRAGLIAGQPAPHK